MTPLPDTVGLSGGLTALSLAVALSAPGTATADPGSEAGALHSAWQVGGCPLCHDVPGEAPAARQDSCADCHAWIREVAATPAARERAQELFPLWERYEDNVASYLAVPSLDAAMARLEPGWVDAWLEDPHDLRPGMAEGMPRFDLDEGQRAAIVGAFAERLATVPVTPPPDRARLSEGAALFTERGCAGCHSLGALHAEAVSSTAPDLAVTRQRMSSDHVAAWIRDPGSLSPGATMPTLPLAEAELLALRDYVLLADLSDSTEMPPAAPLPPPTRDPVRWADVEREVFGKICVHCHMDPDQNEGRAGPGNAGGFGWAATGIELQTYEGVVAVADRIPAALARRRAEAARDAVSAGHRPRVLNRPERPGMPLGLPPLDDAQTALVLGWIAQGMPR